MTFNKRTAAVSAAALVGIFGFWAWRSSWTAPPTYGAYGELELAVAPMTDAEYGDVGEHDRPYVLDLEAGEGAVLLYGAEHTNDPQNPQIADLEARWHAFKPTVALVEGRMGFLPPLVADPVRQFGESGAVYRLARAAGVPVYTWEVPLDKEIAAALAVQPRERVALFVVLRPYFGNLRHGKPSDPEAFVEEFRQKRTQWPGLENSLESVEAIDALWKRDFAGLPDWRDTSDEFGLPGYLAEIARQTNALRDEHLARTLIDLARKGQRVFAGAGSAHSVKLEGTLRAALGK